jgi:hypothetical protein
MEVCGRVRQDNDLHRLAQRRPKFRESVPMPANLRLAFTADLHWGARDRGDIATRRMF